MPLRLGALFFLTALLSAAPQPPPSNGGIMWIYQVTDVALWESANRAGAWKDFYLLCARFTPEDAAGYVAWAAYYAGREAIYREQLDELYRHVFPQP